MAELRKRKLVEGRIVDVGCGPGIAAQRFVRAGYDVLGIDVSRDMLALARQTAPAATFRHGSFVDADLPDCVAVTALGEVLNYDFAPDAEDHIAAFFARARAALRPGGILVLDVAGPGRLAGGPERSWFDGRDWAILVETSEERRARELTRRMTVFRRAGGGEWRRTEAEHHQRLYPASRIVELLRDAGFRAPDPAAYEGEEPFAAGHRAFVATRT